MIVALNYHRRHSTNCEGHHASKSFTSEPEERKKGWTRCKCPIVASGTLGRIAKRMATKQTDWATAAAMMAPYIAANSWMLDAPPEPPQPHAMPPAKPSSGAMGIEQATQEYIKAHEGANSAQMTVIGHRLRMATIVKFAQQTGAITLGSWSEDLVAKYLNQFQVAMTTKQKYHNVIKALFAFCQSKKWIQENPAKLPSLIKNRCTRLLKTGNQKHPFTNADLERMYIQCQRYSRGLKWEGEDLADFIAVSVHTGLRISNVATFNVNRLRGDEVQVKTVKGGNMVYTVVPPWLADRIRARSQKYGPLIFGAHQSERIDVITSGWRGRLIELWKDCGEWDIHPTPHRFRHTFARILLESGRSYAEVAELIGDTEAVVREYYSSWVPGRQEQLSRKMRESFINVPTPKTLPREKIVIMKRG